MAVYSINYLKMNYGTLLMIQEMFNKYLPYTIKRNYRVLLWSQVGFFSMLLFFWLLIWEKGLVDTRYNYLFGLLLGVMPLLGFL